MDNINLCIDISVWYNNPAGHVDPSNAKIEFWLKWRHLSIITFEITDNHTIVIRRVHANSKVNIKTRISALYVWNVRRLFLMRGQWDIFQIKTSHQVTTVAFHVRVSHYNGPSICKVLITKLDTMSLKYLRLLLIWRTFWRMGQHRCKLQMVLVRHWSNRGTKATVRLVSVRTAITGSDTGIYGGYYSPLPSLINLDFRP